MIENVIKDCLYFLMLACLILVGFGLALFTMMRYCIDDHKDGDGSSPSNSTQERDDQVEKQLESSFRTPYKAILTLFYAMVGTFEPEVMFEILIMSKSALGL